MRLVYLLLAIVFLSGCQHLSNSQLLTEPSTPLKPCPVPEDVEVWSTKCELGPWLTYWIAVSQLHWIDRKAMIAELAPLDNDADALKVILLSQVTDTPYQPRLRAQRYAQALIDSDMDDISQFVQFMVFEPAQRRLELESAITTLSRINTENDKQIQQQSEQIKQQTQRIAEQATQLEKILQIEKSIVEQPTEDTP